MSVKASLLAQPKHEKKRFLLHTRLAFSAHCRLRLTSRNKHIQTQTPDLCVLCAQFDLELKPIHLLLDMRPCPIRLLAAQSKLVEVIFTISMLYNCNLD